MMNKPAGVLSATEDRACATVLDLLPPELRALGLSPAGRLDKDAEGLLILSNDGALVHRISSPKREVWKRYRVELVSPAPENCDALFRAGVALDGGYICLPARFFPGPGTREGIVCVREGKFHQVKRMLAAVGSGVARLERLSVGGLALDPALPPGGFRELSDAEIDSIFDMEKYMKLLDL
jgi:16S rRNA pseudouridine516 synthase